MGNELTASVYDVGEASAEDYADLIRLGAGGDIAKEFNG